MQTEHVAKWVKISTCLNIIVTACVHKSAGKSALSQNADNVLSYKFVGRRSRRVFDSFVVIQFVDYEYDDGLMMR